MLQTVCFDHSHQAYHVMEQSNEDGLHVCAYESLLDYNVFHLKRDEHGNKYVPVKYELDDIIEEHVQGCNPLNL